MSENVTSSVPSSADALPIVTVNLNGYLRLRSILRLLPVGKTSWWEGVRTGKYPQAVKLGPKMTAWRVLDIKRLLESYS